jgi:hypothetical protein
MPNSEISNLEVRERVASLPLFIKRWSTILVITMLFLCVFLTHIIKYKSILSLSVEIEQPYNLPSGYSTTVKLNGAIPNDQIKQVLGSRQCILKFFNTQKAFSGKISGISPTNKENQYTVSFIFNQPQDLEELKKFNGALSGAVQVVNNDETVLKKIIANYIR